jgi:hypothetical protein
LVLIKTIKINMLKFTEKRVKYIFIEFNRVQILNTKLHKKKSDFN